MANSRKDWLDYLIQCLAPFQDTWTQLDPQEQKRLVYNWIPKPVAEAADVIVGTGRVPMSKTEIVKRLRRGDFLFKGLALRAYSFGVPTGDLDAFIRGLGI